MNMEEQTEERIFYKSNDIKLTIDTHIMGLGSLILSERYVINLVSTVHKINVKTFLNSVNFFGSLTTKITIYH